MQKSAGGNYNVADTSAGYSGTDRELYTYALYNMVLLIYAYQQDYNSHVW